MNGLPGTPPLCSVIHTRWIWAPPHTEGSWVENDSWDPHPWWIHGAGIYGILMLTWLGYIDGIHGAPYIAYMDPMGDRNHGIEIKVLEVIPQRVTYCNSSLLTSPSSSLVCKSSNWASHFFCIWHYQRVVQKTFTGWTPLKTCFEKKKALRGTAGCLWPCLRMCQERPFKSLANIKDYCTW